MSEETNPNQSASIARGFDGPTIAGHVAMDVFASPQEYVRNFWATFAYGLSAAQRDPKAVAP